MKPNLLRPKDMDFLERRQGRLRRWPLVASILLLMLVALATWLYLIEPLLIDPLAVVKAVESGALDDGTVALMVLFTPVLILMLFAIVTIMIFFAFVSFNHEGRYQAMIATLLISTGGADDGD